MRDVAYSPSGRHIASAALDGDVKIWSASNGSQVCTDNWLVISDTDIFSVNVKMRIFVFYESSSFGLNRKKLIPDINI